MSLSCCMAVGELLPRSTSVESASEAANLTRLELEAALEIQAVITEYTFKSLQLLLQAFTTRSFTRSARSSVGNNERMEFLGDETLSFIISKHLYDTYYISEGGLSELRQLLRSNETLASVGRKLGLDKHIRRSHGEKRHGDPTDNQVAGTVEALICAIYLDGGIEKAWAFVANHILSLLPDLLKSRDRSTDGLDPKSALQKLAQTRLGIMPTYKVVAWGGVYPHSKTIVAVMIGERELARVKGKNKKEASKSAAEIALRVLKNEK